MRTMIACGLSAALLAGCVTPSASPAPVPSYLPERTFDVPQSLALASVANAIYAATLDGVRVIDPDAGTLAKTVSQAGFAPTGLVAFHDQRYALVWDAVRGNGGVLAPLAEHALNALVKVKGTITEVVMAPDDQSAVAALSDRATLLKLSLTPDPTNPRVSELPLGGPDAGDRTLAYDGTWAVVADRNGPSVTVLELATGKTRALEAGERPGPVALAHPDAETTFVLVGHGGTAPALTIFDLKRGTSETVGGLGAAPTAIAVDEDLSRAWLSLPDQGAVAAIDLISHKLLTRLKTGQRPGTLAVVPSLVPGRFTPLHAGHAAQVWVGDETGAVVSVLDAEWLQPKAAVQAGAGPHRFAFLGTQAYIATPAAVTMVDRRRLPLQSTSP